MTGESKDVVTLAHGEGARVTRRWIRERLLPRIGNAYLRSLSDAAILPSDPRQLAFTTDGHVVTPLHFPGGSIGSLAVYSAVNDLFVVGADPAYLSLGLILEEGFPLSDLDRILSEIADAVRRCRTSIVTGDTKVVPRGVVDRCLVTISGVGYVRPGIDLGPDKILLGDRILISGTIGDHGVSILSARESLFEPGSLVSDAAPIHDLVATMWEQPEAIRFLRDPTRGGVAAVLHELVESRSIGVVIEEAALPVAEAVRGACELLGLDPLFVPNEGKVVAIVAADHAERVLARLRSHPQGQRAAIIGKVTKDAGRVVVKGLLGVNRPLIEPAGAPLPRIC